MKYIVGVRFRKAGKIYYFAPNGLDIHMNDGVIVDTSRGTEYGYIASMPQQVEDEVAGNDLKPVKRIATVKDQIQLARNRERQEAAFDICLEKIKKLQVPMKLLRAEYTFDRTKIIFLFTADGRVDFRELVKELAAIFHVRIELRQVGVRDQAKQVGGIGPCGRTLCCATYLGEFAPVSIKMAKIQGLSLNPTKISGACGRLMCCLTYENDQYEERAKTCRCPLKTETKKFFRVGMRVISDEGEGQVVYVNDQKHSVKIQLEGGSTKIFPWDAVEQVDNV